MEECRDCKPKTKTERQAGGRDVGYLEQPSGMEVAVNRREGGEPKEGKSGGPALPTKA